MLAIRGATTVEKNSVESIKSASIELIDEIIKRNNINIEDINTLLFSCTKDITKAYPGKFVREFFDLTNVAIMHFNEMHVEDSLKLCIRVLMYIKNQDNKRPEFVYLRKARELRRDLSTNI